MLIQPRIDKIRINFTLTKLALLTVVSFPLEKLSQQLVV